MTISASIRPAARCASCAGWPIRTSCWRSRQSPRCKARSLLRRVGRADLLQDLRRDGGDVGDLLLQLFAGEGPDGELGALGLGQEFGILHGGVEGATKRFYAILGHVRRHEEGCTDLGGVDDRAEDLSLLIVARELDD